MAVDPGAVPAEPVRLNRTSVGLKSGRGRPARLRLRACLNRTSVGLKSFLAGMGVPAPEAASIEPAWD